MTIELTKKFDDGSEWGVTSSGFRLNEPCIMVPITSLANMDDVEIGKRAKSLLQLARYAKAINFADWLNIQGSNRLPDFVLNDYAADIEMLKEFRGQDKLIDLMIEKIAQTETRRGAKMKARAIRSYVSANYDALFMEVGRRDGFHCAICLESPTHLQIDHIVAVINGGTNNLSNLQLLCQPCNGRKSDK